MILFVLGGTMMSREQIVREYDTLLHSYARFCELGRESLRMNHVERALVSLVLQHVDDRPPRMVALAGVAGALAALELSYRMLPSPHVEFRCKVWRETKVEAARESAAWLCRQTPGCVRLFWVPKKYIAACQEDLLSRVDEYFPSRCMEAYKHELRELFEEYDAARQLGKARTVVRDDSS